MSSLNSDLAKSDGEFQWAGYCISGLYLFFAHSDGKYVSAVNTHTRNFLTRTPMNFSYLIDYNVLDRCINNIIM